MTYLTNFQHADDIASHLTTIVPNITDPLLKAKYAGFMSVAAVTVYEMAIKQIFCDFASQKHRVLGSFTESFFHRINGRIRIDSVKTDYIKPFGQKYLQKFNRIVASDTKDYLAAHSRDITSSYSNIIVWRNDFSHQARTQSLSTFAETVSSYEAGKAVIACIAKTMTR